MKEIPTISFDDIHPDFLNSEEIKMILNSQSANLTNFRELYISFGIIDFSDTKENFAQNLSTVHFNIDFASNFIDVIYSKSKFELGIITIIVEDDVSIEEIQDIIYEKEQKTINVSYNPRVRASHLEHDKYVHIKFMYKISIFAGKKPVIAHLTSYGIGTVKNLGNNKSQVDISVIIRHDTDFTVFRDAIERIFYLEYGNGSKMIPLNIPEDKEQINIIKQTYNKIVKEFDIQGLIECEILRYGARDESKSIFLRPRKLRGKDFDFEDIDELIEAVKKDKWIFHSFTFAFLDDFKPNYLIKCSYHFKPYKTTVKFISSNFSEEDFKSILVDDETKRRSVEKMKELKHEDLEYDEKFYILHRLISYLKDTYYELNE